MAKGSRRSSAQSGLGVDIDKLQAEFDKVLAPKLERVKALTPPKNWSRKGNPERSRGFSLRFQAQVARVISSRRRSHDEAFKVLERAAKMVPMATGPRSPHAIMAQMSLQRDDRARAISELEQLLAHANTDLDSARLLAKQLEATSAPAARLMAAYERIAQLDPFDAANHSLLGRLKMQGATRGRPPENSVRPLPPDLWIWPLHIPIWRRAISRLAIRARRGGRSLPRSKSLRVTPARRICC